MVGSTGNKANSALLELGLGLSLAKWLILLVPSVLNVTITTCFIPLQNCIISAEYLSHHTMSENCTKCNIYWWLCTFSFALVLGYILQKYLPYECFNTTLDIWLHIYFNTKGCKSKFGSQYKTHYVQFHGAEIFAKQNCVSEMKTSQAEQGHTRVPSSPSSNWTQSFQQSSNILDLFY